ncbi:MAG: hypothetical protein HDR29_02725, partial [Lachnospiraceae bacterium]|nr:hypothetical protein [Lachnospiraceae bacterium]
MDSKRLRGTLIAVVAMFVIITGVIIAVNWDIIQKKFGIQQTVAQADSEIDGTVTEIDEKQLGNNLYAYMQDETFFDPEVRYKSIETFSGRVVSLVMSSVAKDLRIMIVNSRGKLVTGVPFSIKIQELGEYVDEDKDGIIYIDGLRAGEYSVS